MASPLVPVDVVPHKRERDWESDIDATRGHGFDSKRLCKDLDVGDLDVELEAEPFEEELISDVMKSLEREIQTHPTSSSVSDDLPDQIDYGSSISPVSNNCGEEGRRWDVDVEYLLEATDNELGIAPSPSTDLHQLTTEEEFDKVFDKDVLQVCLYGDAYAEAESVALFYEDWMSWPLSEGLFEAPHL